jgi:hypothetical protein
MPFRDRHLQVLGLRPRVRVGIRITADPLYRSGRAELPHPAPVLGQTVNSRQVLAHSVAPAAQKDTDDGYNQQESSER